MRRDFIGLKLCADFVVSLEIAMKKILLSFKPFWAEKIMTGEKIYEYRKRFGNEPVMAYMYVSKPIKAIQRSFRFWNIFFQIKQINKQKELEKILLLRSEIYQTHIKRVGFLNQHRFQIQFWI